MALGRAPKIISEIKEYIQDLKRNYEETQLPVTDDSVALHKLCAKLEYMLQIDMKPSARSGMFAGKKDYWDYIYQCLYKVKGLDDGIRFVRGKSEVKTSLGRGRAFIRYSLAHHRLGDSLQQCFNNQKITSLWYTQSSLLLNPSMYNPLVSDLYDLNDLEFDLAPSGHDLDASWPTYSRRGVGASPGMYSWQLPSRTDSLSSLSSQPSTLDSFSSPTFESRPSIGEEGEPEDGGIALRIRKELEECEVVNRELRRRIIQLEGDSDEMRRFAMETEERMSGVQSDLERKVQQLQYSFDKATKEATDARQDAAKSESDWQRRLEDAERINSELCNRLEAVNVQHASEVKLWQEGDQNHRVAMIDAERASAQVKVELAGVMTELRGSRDAERRKEEAVKGLEERLGVMESKNAELLHKMEGMVDSKDAEVATHVQSANKVHELLDKLSEAETRNLDLRGERDALNRRVELLEDSRSSQESEMVGKVAELEQSLGQKDTQSKTVQEELETRVKEHEHIVDELKASLSTLQEEKENLEFSLTEHVKTIDASKKASETSEQELAQSRKEFAAMKNKTAETHKDLERVRKELHAAGVQNEELKTRMKHTEEVGQDRQKEIDDLYRQLKDNSATLTEVGRELEREKEKSESLGKQIEEKDTHIQKVVSETNSVSEQLEKCHDVLVSSGEPNYVNEVLQNCSSEDTCNKEKGALLQIKMAKIISERNDAVRTIDEVKSENNQLQLELQTLKENASNDQACTSEMASQAENTRIEVSSLQQKLESLVKTLDNKEKSLQGQNLEMQRLEGRLQSTAEEKEKLELDIVRLRLAIESKDKERTALIDERTKLEDARDTIQKDLDAAVGINEASRNKSKEQAEVISGLMSDLERLKEEKKEAEQGRDGVQKLLDRERATTRQLEDTVEDLKRLQEETVSLEQVYEERKAKMTQEHGDKVEFLTEQFQMLKEEQEKTSAERLHYQEQTETLGRELDEVKEKCEVLETENKAVKDKNTDLNMEILRLQEEVELAKTERNEITDQLEQVSTETSQSLQDSKQETEKLLGRIVAATEEEKERATRIGSLEAELEEERMRREEAEKGAEEAREEVRGVRALMEEEVTALKYQQSSEAMQYQQTLQGLEEQVVEVPQLKARTEEQDQTISELQAQVSDLTQEMEREGAKLEKQLSEQECEMARQEKQILIHQDSVKELSTHLEEESKSKAAIEAEVKELRNANGTRVETLESELTLVKDDNEQLKKQLVKLVREKDTLWQRTEKLEYNRKMKSSERWMDDKKVTHCMQCVGEFSLTVRKHHCRLCGGIFCGRCAKFFVLTSHSKSKSRVCEQCFVGHQHSLEAESLNTSIITSPGSSEDIVDIDVDHDSQPGTPSKAPSSSGVVSDEGTSDMMSESTGSEPVRMEDVDETLRVVSDSAASLASQRDEAQPVSEGTSSEPDFDIIGDDEVKEARREPEEEGEKEEPRTEDKKGDETDGKLVNAEELEEEGMTGEEVVVAPYFRHTIPIAINEVGLMLCWEFVSSPKSIGFSVVFQESVSSSEQEDLIPLCRCNSHQQAVQGELLARRPGIYSLIFDNKFSRFTSKTVKFSLQIKRPEAAY